MALVRLTYVSDPPAGLDDGGIEGLVDSIRAVSLAHNLRNGVTGALAYSENVFVQTIEGAPERIDALFARIRADARHGNVRIAERREAPSRLFPDWAMAFARIDFAAGARDLSAPALTGALVDATNALDAMRAMPRTRAAALARWRQTA